MYKLKIILASTRSGRKGPAVAEWITAVAQADARFETELVDLKQVNLPFLDEPNHPRLRKYTHEHTKAWSALIDGADAFIFVMPEYNYGYSAPLKNAIDFVFREWHYKPVGLVSYGGVSGGLRAVHLLKPVLTAVQLTVAGEVPIPFFQNFIGEDGVFRPNEVLVKAAPRMLDGIAKWAEVLGPVREEQLGS
ncbi:MAG: NAD(P)H-dependent oxidoreductase [Flavobacteriales bacterium]|nr:NAD(P)H-dependent oxidoreductase [Flavobacteriales bacterium]